MQRNERHIVALALTFALAIALAASVAIADPNAPTALSEVTSSSRDLTLLSAQSAQARGGNVTEVNIDALTQTKVWQGYYGSVTGEITLDNANNFTFYNWSMTTVQGEVYATRTSTVTWANVNCTNATFRAQENVYINRTATDGDSVTLTYSQTSHPAFGIGSVNILANSCNSTYGFVNNASQSQNWSMVLLTDYTATSNATVFASIINDSVVGFDGAAHDFQLLVTENENTGFIGTTTYYFWVELS